MAFQLPGLPNFQTDIPKIPDPIQKYAEIAQLKGMLSDLSQRQQLQPLQIQEAQQKLQQEQMASERQRIELQDQHIISDYLKTGNVAAETPNNFSTRDDIATLVGIDKNDPMMGFLSGLANKGYSGQGLMEQAQKMITRRQEYNKGTEELQTIQKNERQFWQDTFATLHNLPEDQRSVALAAKLPLLIENSKSDPQLATLAKGLAGHPEVIDHVYNAISADNAALGLQQKKAEATKAELAVAPPSATQLSTFTKKTIPSLAALRPEQKNAFIAEAQGARTVDELNKVIERADATDKAEQMHRDSLAQTVALKGVVFGQKGLEANDKTWSDPQHGYVTVASQIKVVKDALQAGVDGNGLAASMAPTMTALGINSFNQMHRISPQEAQSAAMPGGYVERFNAWADKAFTGKLSPQVAKEGKALMDELQSAAHSRAVQASQMHAVGYNIPAKSMPAMDREGNVTTLDKVITKGAGAAPAGDGGGAFKVPAGAPAAPKEDGHKLKQGDQVIAISQGGHWVAP